MADAVKPKQPPRGRFITFEGGEGSGKSTQIQLLADRLNAAKLRTITTREPGGSAGAEIIRHLLLSGMAKAFGPETESLLFAAARDDHVSQVIEPALAQGTWVLCDRFTDATFAYQGGGRGFDSDVLTQLEAWVQCGRQPDLTLWFELAPAVAAERRAAARVPDRFERQDEAFFARVHAGYAKRCAAMPQRFARIDAAQHRDAVRAQVLAAVQTHGQSHAQPRGQR